MQHPDGDYEKNDDDSDSASVVVCWPGNTDATVAGKMHQIIYTFTIRRDSHGTTEEKRSSS